MAVKFPIRPTIGQAAEARHAIRAQERLPTSSATSFVLGFASNGIVPTPLPTATAAATATQPAISLLYTVTATGNSFILSWASVATLSAIHVEMINFQVATRGSMAARTSTDGVTFDSGATAYSQSGYSAALANIAIHSAAGASEMMFTATGGGVNALAFATYSNLSAKIWIPIAAHSWINAEMAYGGIGGPASTVTGPSVLKWSGNRQATTQALALQIYCHNSTASFIDGLAKVYGHA